MFVQILHNSCKAKAVVILSVTILFCVRAFEFVTDSDYLPPPFLLHIRVVPVSHAESIYSVFDFHSCVIGVTRDFSVVINHELEDQFLHVKVQNAALDVMIFKRDTVCQGSINPGRPGD